jgi:hypothetical protein
MIDCSLENVCRLLCNICDWDPDSLIMGNSALLRALASSLSFHIVPSWRIDGSGGGHLTGWSLSGGSRGCSTGLNSSVGSTPWLSAKVAGESLPDGVPSRSSVEAWDRRPALLDVKREKIPTIPTHLGGWIWDLGYPLFNLVVIRLQKCMIESRLQWVPCIQLGIGNTTF